ncbi:hypothetical protein GX51_04160 [Blastomyces parvus]|uniref:Uncharacterized protein n=1 Tax=Blastomyces parvus TaxID=2060905 RepID=A0A2B7X358_9EURO|nr:hypothetical protein GX51_04160 [Blastomyces parvus]
MGGGLNTRFIPDATINMGNLFDPGSLLALDAHSFGFEQNPITPNNGSVTTMPPMANDSWIEASNPTSPIYSSSLSTSFLVNEVSGWTVPPSPTSFPWVKSPDYTRNEINSFSQMALPLYPPSEMIDPANHSTSNGQSGEADQPQASANRTRSTPCRTKNRRLRTKLKSRQISRSRQSSGKPILLNFPSNTSRPAQPRTEPQRQQPGHSFVEHTFDASTGEPVTAGVKKRLRTKAEKQETAEIRKLGGACGECRRKRRRCSLDHKRADSLSTENATSNYLISIFRAPMEQLSLMA